LYHLPNAQVVGIGSDPNEGTQGTHLIDVFEPQLPISALHAEHTLRMKHGIANGCLDSAYIMPNWERLVTVGQWEHWRHGIGRCWRSRWSMPASSETVALAVTFAVQPKRFQSCHSQIPQTVAGGLCE